MAVSGKVTALSDAEFRAFVAQHPRCVIDFWGEGCVYCRPMARVVEEVASDLAGRVDFASVNIDEHQANAAALGIMALPTNVVFRNGEVVDSIQGLMPKQEFAARIHSRLSP